MWDSEIESVGEKEYENGVLTSSKPGLNADGFEQKGQSWYVATDIPSDFLIKVGDSSFHLHKYPLLSRSGKINRIIHEPRYADLNKVVLDDFPGGPEAFNLAAKFCYGLAVDLTPTNISGLRCAAEYLEMTEEMEEGNLVSKTEAFLSYVILSSWRDTTLVLKNCEKLSPWAENLQIVRRCSDSIAWKACANPKEIRWSYTGKHPKSSSPDGNELNSSSSSRSQQVPPDWWFQDVSILRIDHFVRIVSAIKVKGMRFELIGAAIMHYAGKWLPCLIKERNGTGDEGSSNSNSNGSTSSWKEGQHMIAADTKDQRLIIESIISIIPQEKDSVTCSFLLRLLRMANMLKVAPALVTELEKRVGMQLEQATLADLLIPCYSKCETLYDVDLVQRLLEHFIVQEQIESFSPSSMQSFPNKYTYEGSTQWGNNPYARMRVSRLLDSYLTEVSTDRNLSLTKFQVLAEALPESPRTCDDGLYRAIDSYLKAHPTLSEHERKRLCRVMDYQNLSLDACMHAAQNERLPLRVMVQVLFFEQVKIRNALALATNSLKEAGESQYQPLIPNRRTLLEGTPISFQEGRASAKKDINILKLELENIKEKYLELQNEMGNLQRQFDKMPKPKQPSTWASVWKKYGKLTMMTALEINYNRPHIPESQQTRRAFTRWRNSVS